MRRVIEDCLGVSGQREKENFMRVEMSLHFSIETGPLRKRLAMIFA